MILSQGPFCHSGGPEYNYHTTGDSDKKSYDPVSHSWISKIIEVYKIDDTA